MKNRSCAICQPHYLPWIGYFEMIDRVDDFVYFDDVQYEKQEWKNRNRVRKTSNSTEPRWLSVPIRKKTEMSRINQVELATDVNWRRKHLSIIEQSYYHAPFYGKYFSEFKEILLSFNGKDLASLNIMLIDWFLVQLGITTPVARSSQLKVTGKREEKVSNICIALGSDHYLANNMTATYVKPDYFTEKGIKFSTQDFKHPEYRQQYRGEVLPFLSHLSIIDLLLNSGPESLTCIQAGRPNDWDKK